MAHYRIAISACASLGDGPRAAALLHRMQQRGMGYADAAADAMFACNKSGIGDVALDIFHGLVVESGGLRRSLQGEEAWPRGRVGTGSDL